MLSRNRIEHLLESFQGKKVIILGDLMLDEFVWGKVRRISPEAPVPVVEVIEETYRLGGAANVAANIQTLGATPILLGVVGDDRAAAHIRELTLAVGIDASRLVQDNRPTTLKTRILAHNQQIARTDRESRSPLPPDVNRKVETAFLEALPDTHAVIVSDYDKGVVNRELLETILPKARAMQIPVFLDPKVHHADYYRPITTITPNQHEAELLSGTPIRTAQGLETAGTRLLERFGCEYVLITRGEEGMSLFDTQGSHHLPTFAREVFDVTGAGDTVIAALSVAHAAGATMQEAAILANHAAGVVVGKIGTATVSRSELLSDFDSRNAYPAG
jgi:D-beta-D-heptose 7-phosphate kinase/D-beta-D-heptose 1-phosphate adenosyltransferase